MVSVAWINEELAKYPEYTKLLVEQAKQPTQGLEDVMKRTDTHAYSIVTAAKVRQEHMRNFVSSSLQLPNSSLHDLVRAVEIDSTTSLNDFVEKGILSKDYNASWRHQKMNPGRLACQLSLVHTLEAFLKSTHKNALIFEDDVAVSDGLTNSEAQSLTAQLLLLRDWDVLYLGYCHSCQSRGTHKGTLWLSNDVIALCAHAIVFNRKAARVFLRRWKPIHGPGDNKLTQIICQTGLQVIRPILPIYDQDRSLGKSQTGTKNKPLRPFMTREACHLRQQNCPIIAASQMQSISGGWRGSSDTLQRYRRAYKGFRQGLSFS